MEKLIQHPPQTATPTPLSSASKRLISLDVFRGITIALMIIVNTPGKGAALYPYLVHAKWFGLTLADIVFPSFLFAVGLSMSYSLHNPGMAVKPIPFKQVLRRTLVIFALGYLLYWFPFFTRLADGAWVFKSIEQTRIMGVLQRIALCYLCAWLMIRYLTPRTLCIVACGILAGYWAVLYLFGEPGRQLTLSGNAIVRFDVWLMGIDHVYKKDVAPFDPEGLLSTLPAVVNVLAGFWAGKQLRENGPSAEYLLNLMIAGALLLAGALGWGLLFPISKKLWTSTFTLCTIGIDLLVLGTLVYWIENKQRRAATNFFTVFGKNSLFIYLFSELFYIILSLIKLPSGTSLFEWGSIQIFQQILPGPGGALLTALVFMLACWLAAWWLDKKRIYIKI